MNTTIALDLPVGENDVMTGTVPVKAIQVTRSFCIHDVVGADPYGGIAVTHIHTMFRAVLATDISSAITACEELEDCGIEWGTGSVESIRVQASVHQQALRDIIEKAKGK